MARTLFSMRFFRRFSLTWGGALLFSACGLTSNATNAVTCTDPTGSAWVPNVTGVSQANHDSSAVLATTTQTTTGPIVGYNQAATAAKETAISFTVGSDLGTYGSLALEATITSMPSGQVVLYPMLVSLVDPNGKEWINLGRTGAGGDCAASGYFTSTGARNSSCTVSFPSAYRTRDHWEQSQLQVLDDSPSVNLFPTCNWAGGTTATSGDPACAFNSDFFTGGKLPTGSYTARYVMLSGTSATASGTGGLKVKIIQKSDTSATSAFDINVVIVGSSNVQASRTAKGQLNLDTLMSNVVALYNTGATPIKVGTIRAYEWGCAQGGDSYAQVATSSMGDIIRTGATMLPSEATTGAVTLYMTQSFTDAPGVVGISASLGGPLEATYLSSGVLVPTFGKLESYNPNCSTSSCPVTSQDADFADLGPTVAHEMGHYFGLNHPSESAGTKHDPLGDTPICTATSASGKISIGTCLNTDTNVYPATSMTCNASCAGYSAATGTYCPTQLACQFNHLMYWSTKNFTEGAGTGDGNLISAQSRLRVLAHPLIQ